MGVKDLYDGMAGYDIITGEHLSSQERTDKLLLGTGVMGFNLLLPVLSGLGVGKTIGQKLRAKADNLFRLEGVSPHILGETANELAEHTITSGIASELSAPSGYGSTADITAVSPSPAGEGIEETVEAVSREGVEELQEQAVTEVVEVIESGNYFGLRDLMSPEEIARCDEHWINVAENISNEALDNQIAFIKSGGITKPDGGKYQLAKICVTVDLNTGDIYFGYNGAFWDNLFINTKRLNDNLKCGIVCYMNSGRIGTQKRMGDCDIWNLKELAEHFQQLAKNNMKQLVNFGMKCPRHLEEKILEVLGIIGLRLQ